MKQVQYRLVTLALMLVMSVGSKAADGMGDIDFPNSGNAAAQDAFITGVKALHSFQFDEAQLAFQQAQQADPSFALAYWGEAMSVNKPLWRIQDTAGAQAILQRLAPNLDGRLAKAPTEKEQAWLMAVEKLFYGSNDKLVRDTAYANAMKQMHERWPGDHEIAIFHALSILGTMRPGDQGFRRQARAAAISLAVFEENPHHPGAAHFTIHSFDDPDHAILALPAARVYAGIAPDAAHALHMPSHIFLQLGMWKEVIASNIDAYNAAVSLNRRMNLPEGREDFHTLSWLAYGNLMLGDIEAAEANLADARAALDRNPQNARVEDGYLNMRARHLLESNAMYPVELPAKDTTAGMHANWVAAVGILAAKAGDVETASRAIERISQLGSAAAAAGDAYEVSRLSVLRGEVDALLHLSIDEVDAAISAARKAAETEKTLGAPSGPPDPIKPAWELYGEILLMANRPADAMIAFEESLEWIPQRTPSLLGLARAAADAGDTATAVANYQLIAEMPGMKNTSQAMQEAVAELD